MKKKKKKLPREPKTFTSKECFTRHKAMSLRKMRFSHEGTPSRAKLSSRRRYLSQRKDPSRAKLLEAAAPPTEQQGDHFDNNLVHNKKKRKSHNNNTSRHSKAPIMTTVELQFQLEQDIGKFTTWTLRALHKRRETEAVVELQDSMLLTRFEPLRKLMAKEPSQKRRSLSPKQWRKRNVAQRKRARMRKNVFATHDTEGMILVNALSPWTHPQRSDPSLPSYTEGSIGYTPYVDKGRIFGPKEKSQVSVMATGD